MLRKSLSSQTRHPQMISKISSLKLFRTMHYRWFKSQKRVVLAAKLRKAQKVIDSKDFSRRLSNIHSSSCSRTWRPISLSRGIGTLLPSKILRTKTDKLMEILPRSQKEDKIEENLRTIMKPVLTKKMRTYWPDCSANHHFWKVNTHWEITNLMD